MGGGGQLSPPPPKSWGGSGKGLNWQERESVILNSGAEGTESFFCIENGQKYFFLKYMANDEFSEPPRRADSKNPIFIFCRIFGPGHLRGPGVSLGRILGGRSIEPVFWGGGLVRGLHRTHPPHPLPRRTVGADRPEEGGTVLERLAEAPGLLMASARAIWREFVVGRGEGEGVGQWPGAGHVPRGRCARGGRPHTIGAPAPPAWTWGGGWEAGVGAGSTWFWEHGRPASKLRMGVSLWRTAV